MEIESTLPEPAAAAAAATRSLTSKNAAAAGGSPGMPPCGDAIALLLLQAGASCTIQNRYAPEVLTRAAPTSEARALWDSALASLLAVGADVSKYNGNGQNALHVACRANLVVVIRQLLGQPGVDVNAPELGTGLTPLMLALRNAQSEPVALVLLRHGADATLRNALGGSAEDLAGPQLWASLLRQAALAPDSIDDDDDHQRHSSAEGVDHHRATGLLSSAPRPRPGAISLVARREAKGVRLLQQAKANRLMQRAQPAPEPFAQHLRPYMGFTSAADH
ncbi:ankyrin repeat-containing protein [Acanthamoeba castellanii str. Neff]|uniref:Ankyrin repeat-containing protein n=1 Tax=Acanthamoeba castellanii (strain ATCC 30010 / Neff) TaxID=1257118 RepID=L8HB31_ACACF|nr:ankyrin repeat-containing protein [Acanthamoeba castellanii str. Neff]ELR21943.1 ankyrin repeat-containing protein [Acanthamoeba castellanii str. Neff]